MPRVQNEPAEAIAEARRMFRAVLAPWASDLLELRRRGLDHPCFRRTLRPVLRAPGAGTCGPSGAGETLALPAPAPRARAA